MSQKIELYTNTVKELHMNANTTINKYCKYTKKQIDEDL